MWNIIEAFRRYGLPVIGGGALVAAVGEGLYSFGLSFISVDQTVARGHENLSCYLGIIAILCGIGYFGFQPHQAINAIESQNQFRKDSPPN